MTILRAPVSILAAAAAQMIGTPLGTGGPAYIVPTYPPSQLGTSSFGVSNSLHLLPATVFSSASQKVTLPAGMDGWLVITPPLLRQIINQLFPSFSLGNLPSE